MFGLLINSKCCLFFYFEILYCSFLIIKEDYCLNHERGTNIHTYILFFGPLVLIHFLPLSL